MTPQEASRLATALGVPLSTETAAVVLQELRAVYQAGVLAERAALAQAFTDHWRDHWRDRWTDEQVVDFIVGRGVQ